MWGRSFLEGGTAGAGGKQGLRWPWEREERRSGREIGSDCPCSVAFRDLIKCGGDKKMAELDQVKLDLVSAWVCSFHHLTSAAEENLLCSSER